MHAFICPHCHEILQVRPEHLGMRGHCRKCGGRIALIGEAREGTQWASLVEEAAPPPASVPQLNALGRLGISPERLEGLSREQAGQWLRRLNPQAPTEKQLTYLRKLGATQAQLAALPDRSAASALIEEMHLQPTRAQLDFLRELGTPGERLARVKSRGEASALIEEMKRVRDAG